MELSILKKYGSLAPSRILRYFVEDDYFQMSHEKNLWTFIVLGIGGPTGKTWLYNGLLKYGFTAVELSESLLSHVEYKDNVNRVIPNDENKTITIILNESLKGE